MCLLVFVAACGSDEDEDDPDTVNTEATTDGGSLTPYKSTGNEGSIAGTITFAGTPPTPADISMLADAFCASASQNPKAEDTVVNDGNLQNVFVYVKDGRTSGATPKSITGFSFEPPSEARVLDQHGCRYVPHVIGVQTGQNLQVKTSDATAHNVNVDASKNPKFNQSQGPGAAPLEKKFLRAETLIPVKCNQHPWMRAYIGVVGHPFYSVSGPDGKFEIKGLPPGTYNLVAWHEKLGEKTQPITIGDKEAKTQDFSFGPGGTTTLNVGSWNLQPALELPMLGGHH
jgi:hypothetical protein